MATVWRVASLVAATTVAGVLVVWSAGAFGPRGVEFAFLVNWIAVSWMAIVGQTLPVLLPDVYYREKHFERRGRIFERLGVRLFQRAVRRGPLAIFNPGLRVPRERTASALGDLDRKMRTAEAGHALVFLAMLALACGEATAGWFPSAAWTTAFNVIVNGYPVMLQRYNRFRLERLIERIRD